MYWVNKTISLLDRVGVFSRWMNAIGIALIFLMVIVTFADVILRYIFSAPIQGVLEITEVMMIAAIFLAVAYTYKEKRHVSVDVITGKLSPKARKVLEFINRVLGLGLLIIMVWRALAQTMFSVEDHSIHSQFLLIPTAPFLVIITLGCAVMCLLLIRDLLLDLVESKELGLKYHHWLLMLGIPVIFIVLVIFWMQPDLWHLNLTLVSIIGAVFCLILFLMGMPISFALIITGFVFIGHIRGSGIALDTLGTDLYRTTGSYTWSVLPFFVLLGFICLYAKFGEDLYRAAYRWFGHLRGGLGVASIGACTGFAAIVGDSVSATATMGAVALPQMRKYDYDDRLSSACIISGASLGPIIPPSVGFIIYGLLTNVSIGDLFVAGIFPGLIMATIFIVTIYVVCRLNPKMGGRGEVSGWRSRFASTKAIWPVIVLFLLVIGGIYVGIFTPTEGGAIGAVVAFFLGLAMRRFTWDSFTKTLLETGKVISMVFLILIGALMFTRFVAWCNLSGVLQEAITGLNLSLTIYVLITLLIMGVLGCFIDTLPIMLIGIPILFPIAKSMGVDPIWFGVLFILDINLGSITPPVGINLFTFKGLAKEVPMGAIYKGILPFVIGTAVTIAIVFVFPSLATWLPAVLK